MKVIIPVAGVGTRLQPHTFATPKPLLRVAEKSILAYILDPLSRLNPEEIVFVIGHKGEQIKEFVEENYNFNATFVWQDKLLGLGYAVNKALEVIDGGPALIILGDTVVECDLGRFIAAGDAVLGVRQVDDPQRFGIAEIKDGVVVGVEEKPQNPKTNLALIGLYYLADVSPLKAELSNLIDSGRRTRGEIQLTDALAQMMDAGARFNAFEVEEWYDCGKKETVLATNRHFLMKLAPQAPLPGVTLVPPVYISPEAAVVESVIGPYVSIGPGARVTRSVVRNSIVASGAALENVCIEDSIIGSKAVVSISPQVYNLGDASEVDFN